MENTLAALKALGGFAVFAFGITFILTRPPQSPENFRKYLEKEGYADVRNIAPKMGYCTKGAVMYSFTARNAEGRAVAGQACMTYSFVYVTGEQLL